MIDQRTRKIIDNTFEASTPKRNIPIKKISIIAISVLVILSLAIFPVQIATTIGTWVNDFFGTLFNTIQL